MGFGLNELVFLDDAGWVGDDGGWVWSDRVMMMMMMIVGSVRERGSDDDGGWVCERERGSE